MAGLTVIVKIAIYIFLPMYVWKIWKTVQHIPG